MPIFQQMHRQKHQCTTRDSEPIGWKGRQKYCHGSILVWCQKEHEIRDTGFTVRWSYLSIPFL